jgi:site-specific recombinase XerD
MTSIEYFRRELIIRKYAFSTIETYESCLKSIFKYIGEKPSVEQIKNYLLNIKGYSYHKQFVGTIHRYFEFVLKTKLDLSDIPYPRKEYKLPEIFSIEEIQAIFNECKNLKHRAIISMFYGCGLRMGEVLNLKIVDIDSKRMIVNVRQGKGNKDRQIGLQEKLLELLRDYVREYKPKEFMFNGQFGLQYTDSSINQLLKYYAKKAGIKKKIHAHLLRHCYATHLLEAGTDMALIQKMLGHKKIETTQIYAHISTALTRKIQSPINNINFNV